MKKPKTASKKHPQEDGGAQLHQGQTLTLRQFIRDNIMRLAVVVLALDWIVVGWKTFLWLDLAAFTALVLARKIDVPEPLPPNMRTLDARSPDYAAPRRSVTERPR